MMEDSAVWVWLLKYWKSSVRMKFVVLFKNHNLVYISGTANYHSAKSDDGGHYGVCDDKPCWKIIGKEIYHY